MSALTAFTKQDVSGYGVHIIITTTTWTQSSMTPCLPLYPSFSSRDTNVSCLDSRVINLSLREDTFIVSQDAQPWIPTPNLSAWRWVGHTDWWETLLYPCRPISLPPGLLLLFLVSLLTWPLVYWHHQLNTASLTICSTNDCVVKCDNLLADVEEHNC